MARARGIRISDELAQEISREAEAQGISWSAMTTALLAEALQMRRVPGIVMVDGPSGRRAVVAGSGLDVWEIIATWQACGKDEQQLAENYPWLTSPQLRAALAYYELYPDDIDKRLAREQQWTPERLQRDFPFVVRRRPRT
jgi:uncharacterized protein (DUF433 family)